MAGTPPMLAYARRRIVARLDHRLALAVIAEPARLEHRWATNAVKPRRKLADR